MQISSKLLRTAILVLGLMVALGLYLSLSLGRISTAKGVVSACSGTDWQKVQCYADKYIQNQYPGASVGEGEGSVAAAQSTPSGFYVNQATLKSKVDSNGDGTYLGEGDDLAKAPVLIDNLNQFTTLIPGTTFRCNWNENSCFEPGSVADVKTQVDDHEAATGQVPAIVDYCLTDHTAAPTTGAWGYIAQTGGLATDGSIPKVYGFTWGRDGWTNTPVNSGSTTTNGIYTYSNTYPVTSPAATATYTPPSTVPGSCTSAGGDADLVRCAAEWAISQDAGEGNVGNGQNVGATMTAGQVVDVRADTPASTVNLNGSLAANQIPINTIFNTGLANVNPAATSGVLIASGSQGPGGIVAEGLRMLGYTTATGGYIHSGVPYYNNTLSVSQGQPNTGTAYPLDAVTAQCTAPSNGCNQIYGTQDLGAEMNTTAAAISSSSATDTGDTTATVSRTTSQPATTKIDLTGSDSSAVHVNNTILHASDTENLTGLHPGVTYTGTLSVYNNMALVSSTPISFTTSGIACAKPALGLTSPPHAYWASLSDYSAGILSVDFTINNSAVSPNAVGVQITGSASNNGVTVNSGIPSAATNIASGGSATVTVTYHIPAGVTWFHTSLTVSAQDECGNSYTYP